MEGLKSLFVNPFGAPGSHLSRLLRSFQMAAYPCGVSTLAALYRLKISGDALCPVYFINNFFLIPLVLSSLRQAED